MSLLYFAVFTAVAWLWRPSDNNRRLAMSDELATDEDDLQDTEFDNLHHGKDDDDEEDRVGRHEVVFDVRRLPHSLFFCSQVKLKTCSSDWRG